MPLPDPSPDLLSLDLLVSVGELGSISAAARAHGISQPAASMRLRDLETTLGLELLDRSTTGSQFTAAGEAMAEWANVVLQGVTDLMAGATALRGERGSKLRVGASMTVAEYLFPGWLTRLTAAVAGVSVSLAMGNSEAVADMVLDHRVDLGFIEGVSVPDGLDSRELIEDRLVVVVGASHAWAHRHHPLTPDELGATPMVVREVGSGTRAVLDAALASHGVTPKAAVELGSTTAIKAAVVAGSGPAAVSELALGRELAVGQLVEVPCAGLDTERWIRAVWPKGRRPSGPAAALVDIAVRGSG